MSAYADDPRVRRVNEYHYSVDAPGGPYHVSVWDDPNRWDVQPALNSARTRAAGLRNREEAEAWAEVSTMGSFSSADEAIFSLIGAPR